MGSRGGALDGEDWRFTRGTSISQQADGQVVITVPGRKRRPATVLDRLAPRLLECADKLGDDLVVGTWPHRKTPVSDLVDAVQGGAGLMRPMPRALRRAYVVEMLTTDINPLVLAEQLGRNGFSEMGNAKQFVPRDHLNRAGLRKGLGT